ncbi:MAG: matrixin family metalloprotease [Bacteroidota bacterium]
MKRLREFIICVIILILNSTTLYSQDKIKMDLARYDDWPTIDANANIRSLYSSEPSIDFVLMGREWDHRIITYFFQNGTPDIAGNAEELAVRDAMEIWSNEADIVFLEVCTHAEADIVILFDDFAHGDPVRVLQVLAHLME